MGNFYSCNGAFFTVGRLAQSLKDSSKTSVRMNSVQEGLKKFVRSSSHESGRPLPLSLVEERFTQIFQ